MMRRPGVNPVLAYAIKHQAKARGVLVNQGVPFEDIEDICQNVFVRLLETNPGNAKGPATYWYRTLHSTMLDYYRVRRYQRLPVGPMEHIEDPSQELEHQTEVREALRQAQAIIARATPMERGAMAAVVRGDYIGNARNQRLFHLRKRLRAAVA